MHIAVLADNIADRKQTERLLDRANSALASGDPEHFMWILSGMNHPFCPSA